jgi:DNA-binding PadR family transcriptional regulator
MPKTNSPNPGALPLSALDLHILLVLSRGELFGYAIQKAVEGESEGVLSPEIGSLYRVLNRLVETGWVAEAATRSPEEGPQRGRPRRYYRITGAGAGVARAELGRLQRVLSRAPDLAPEGAP